MTPTNSYDKEAYGADTGKRPSKKAKARYSPYKTGGGKRTLKKR